MLTVCLKIVATNLRTTLQDVTGQDMKAGNIVHAVTDHKIEAMIRVADTHLLVLKYGEDVVVLDGDAVHIAHLAIQILCAHPDHTAHMEGAEERENLLQIVRFAHQANINHTMDKYPVPCVVLASSVPSRELLVFHRVCHVPQIRVLSSQ